MTGRIVWIVALVLAFGGGFESGRVGRDSPISRILNAPRCASDKQFLVAFTEEPGYGWALATEGRIYWTTSSESIAVDGHSVGYLNSDPYSARTYVCEGVHQATITVSKKEPDIEERYRVEFVVSLPSLFRDSKTETIAREGSARPGWEGNGENYESRFSQYFPLDIRLNRLRVMTPVPLLTFRNKACHRRTTAMSRLPALPALPCD